MELDERNTTYNYIQSLSLDERCDVLIDDDDKTIILDIAMIYLRDEQISDDRIRFTLDTRFVTLQDVYTLLNYFGKKENIYKISVELYGGLYGIFFKKGKEIYLKNNPPVIAKPVVVERKPVAVVERKPVAVVERKPFSEYTKEERERLQIVNPGRHYNLILDEINRAIEDNNLDVLLEPIFFMEGTSSFIIRKIDILLHPGEMYDSKDTQTQFLIEIVNRIASIDISFLIKIFNDRRVMFERHRSFLDGKEHPGAVMSSILIEGHFGLYMRVLELVPEIELNLFDDLSIFFAYVSSPGNITGSTPETYKEKIKQTILQLKSRLPDDKKYLFTKEWFDQIKNVFKNKLRNNGTITVEISELFTGHGGWESSTWNDDYKKIFPFRIDTYVKITERESLAVRMLDRIVSDYFDPDQSGGNYKERYLLIKKLYLELKATH